MGLEALPLSFYCQLDRTETPEKRNLTEELLQSDWLMPMSEELS